MFSEFEKERNVVLPLLLILADCMVRIGTLQVVCFDGFRGN
jgi:hypothetical protein